MLGLVCSLIYMKSCVNALTKEEQEQARTRRDHACMPACSEKKKKREKSKPERGLYVVITKNKTCRPLPMRA